MKTRLRLFVLVLAGSLTPSPVQAQPAQVSLPRLEKRGAATQLIVDGKPYLILGGELENTVSSSLDDMKPIWPRLTRMNLNTVLVAVAWAWVEPVEGRFDFALVDGLLEGARRNDQRVIFLWFGSWKNGLSSFVPPWVKADSQRFPRARLKNGKPIEALSTLAGANREADTRAYVAFMRHLHKVDPQRTVVMIQMQNEVGVLGDSRDRSSAANQAFTQPVPKQLTDYLARNRARLNPELGKLWTSAGSRATGSWEEVFGVSPATDEIFMAWHYARSMDHMTAAGKAVYPLPVFSNSWIVQPEDKGPGDYPSGGPEPMNLDIWKAGAPSLDFNAPDIYLPNFDEWVAAFHRADNPLFVPEARGDAGGVANAFLAIGRHAALGYSPFGIDSVRRLVSGPVEGQSRMVPEPAPEDLPLARGYAVLKQLTSLILDHQAQGTIAAAWLHPKQPRVHLPLGDFTLQVDLRRNRRNPNEVPPLGYGLCMAIGPDEFLCAGTDIDITFAPRTKGPKVAGIADAETGSMRDGRWTPGRKMSGDDILLGYDLAPVTDADQSGSGLRFGPTGPTIQRVKLYRYE